MQFHRFDPETPLDETVRAIDDLVRQGKVLYWGVSEWSSDQIADLVATAKQLNANLPASNQPRYNMLGRDIERSVLPTCARHGLGSIVFSPLAQGVLTGKYLPGQSAPVGSRGADDTSNTFMRDMLSDDVLLANVQKLQSVVNEHGYTLTQFALAWCLRRPELSSVIIGASTVEQVEANVIASGVDIAPELWEEAESILEGRAV
jgi:aryl-alcohol dehydrogenase-like predicted oxidoreductase